MSPTKALRCRGCGARTFGHVDGTGFTVAFCRPSCRQGKAVAPLPPAAQGPHAAVLGSLREASMLHSVRPLKFYVLPDYCGGDLYEGGPRTIIETEREQYHQTETRTVTITRTITITLDAQGNEVDREKEEDIEEDLDEGVLEHVDTVPGDSRDGDDESEEMSVWETSFEVLSETRKDGYEYYLIRSSNPLPTA